MTTIGLWCAWFLAAVASAAVMTRGLIGWASARGVIDIPNERSSHTRSTPRGGGLSIIAVVAAVTTVVVAVRPDEGWRIAAAVLPALAVAAVSWMDDLQSLSNRARFAVHVAAAVAATAAVGAVGRVDLGSFGMLRLGPFAWPLTVLWIVGLTNAFNFMDGTDGIAGITAAAVAAGIAAAAAACGSGAVAVVAAAFAGGAIGFLAHNWQPARIFMGDVGSAFCGFLLAILPLAVRADCVAELMPVAALALWPFVFDTGFTLLRRLRAGENIFRAHRGHLYQRLARSGWSHRGVAALYGGLAACLATVAVVPLVDPSIRKTADHVAAAMVAIVPVLLIAIATLSEWRKPGHA